MESDLHFHCCASNNGMLTSALSIVVRQTMACWRHLFPLLCVKQCNADVSTFHCVCLHTETRFVETDSVWRVIEGRWCFGSGIRIRYPDHHQNLMEWSLGSWLPSRNILFKSVNNFLSNPANRQTDKQTDKQMKGHSESAYFAKLDLQTEWFTLLIDCDKGQGHNQLVLMTQMKGDNL